MPPTAPALALAPPRPLAGAIALALVAALGPGCRGGGVTVATGPGAGGADGAAAQGSDGGPDGSRDGRGGEGADGGSGDGAAASTDGPGAALVGRWWGVLPMMNVGPAGLVLEVADAGSAGSVPARVWVLGSRSNTILMPTAKGWRFSGGGCWDLSLPTDSSPDRLDAASCSPTVPGGGVLRRSRATRIYEEPVSPTGLTFDPAGARFGFTTGDRFWLWDTISGKLGDLGAGTKVRDYQTGLPPIALAYSPDGRRVAYLRGGPTAQCDVANLMLFDTDTGREQALAARVPCYPGFAHFSPDGKLLAYFANDPRDGTGADLTLWSLADGAATVVAAKTNSAFRDAYLVFGPSGRHLVFRGADPRLGVGFNEYETLSSYDVATGQTTKLADAARDVTPSPDGTFVAFSAMNGQVGLWDDRDDSVRLLDRAAVAPDTFYRSGLAASPDGRRFAYLATDGTGHIYDTANGTTIALGSTGISCYTETQPVIYGASFPARMRAAYFAPAATGVLYWRAPMPTPDGCYAGDPASTPFRWRDLGTSREVAGVVLAARQALGPRGEAVDYLRELTVWSPERGVTTIFDSTQLATAALVSPLGVTFTRDGSEIVIGPASSASAGALWVWNTARAEAVQIAPALPGNRFNYRADEVTGAVVFQAGSQFMPPLQLWGASTPAVTLVDRADAPTVSASGRALAARGSRGSDTGIFAFRFGATEATLIEEGQILGLSDTHVYFNAPDGVCVAAY